MSLFNWSGKQSLGDDGFGSPTPSSVTNHERSSQSGDIDTFDHTFKGAIHSIYGDQERLNIFGNCDHAERAMKLICSSQSFQIIEEVTLSKVNKADIPYRLITGVTWDHANSEVKLDLSSDSYLILTLVSSVEFERELRIRFAKLAGRDFKNPTPMYVGIFAGPNKPKPFQRKRPNLSNLPNGKLPPLKEMRNTALDLRSGSYKPCPAGESRRMQLANQHIYEGYNTFKLAAVRGKSDIASMFIRGTSVLLVTDVKLMFRPQGNQGSNIEFSYEDIQTWETIDNEKSSSARESGIEIVGIHGDRIYFGVNFVRDLKHTLEYFWNKFQTSIGNGPLLGSTHGRPIVTVTTLSGEVKASSIPVGQTEVVDIDGIVVRPGGRMAVRNTTTSALKGMMGTVEEPRYVPNHNAAVVKHWNKVVLHQGWLLKQGGAGVGSLKSWIKRYFVLYKTSQGHFLVYYADFTESPLYSSERNARNIVDLAKTTYIRPGSEGADVPNHSFDIVTIEREWTLCAETQENLQKWMKVLTHAVDEDVAILPDEEIIYKVKPKQDPSGVLNPQDYSTSLKVSAHGVSVCAPLTGGSYNNSAEKEVFFWVYTDFFKWSLVVQNEKPALSVNVFTDASFSKKVEYQFRYKEAGKIATAIEFFIEKFMSVMHIRLELTDPDAVSEAVQYDEAPPEGVHAPIKEPEKEIDLLGFDDDLPVVQPIAHTYTQPPAQQAYTQQQPVPQPQRQASVDVFGGDLFGADPFSSPAAVTAAVTPAPAFEDPFGSDPFSDPTPIPAPAVVVPQITVLPPLSQVQVKQIRTWWLSAITNAGGPLYDDGVVQIASKIEIRGSQARVLLFYRNTTDSQVSSLKLSLTDPSNLLRSDVQAVAPELAARGQAQQQIMVEVIDSVYPGAFLELEYLVQTPTGQSKRMSSFEMPLNLASFDDPLALGGPDFLIRWNALVNPGQEVVEVISAPHVTPAIAHKILTATAKFGYVDGVVDKAVGVAGAATIRMGSATPGEKVNVGALLKIEVSQGKVRISSRVTHAAASGPLVAIIKAYLVELQ